LIFDGAISHEPGFLIENLQGDTIDTWVSWRLVEDETLHVNIINADEFPDKVNSIRNVILSEELLRMDNSKFNENPSNSLSQYYVGWKGALEKASSEKNSKFNIPTNFNIIESSLGEGDIIIYLTNLKQGDGLSGTTKLIADASQNQIVKSITVLYEVDNLDELELETIVRHEFGHVLGLAHSTNVDDLMHPLFNTKHPYISECDVNALVTLYDGGKMSRVTCD